MLLICIAFLQHDNYFIVRYFRHRKGIAFLDYLYAYCAKA